MKRWTERQAWRYLAGRWARAQKIPGTRTRASPPRVNATVLNQVVNGLCSSVSVLEEAGRISTDVSYIMKRSFPPVPALLGGYVWPRTMAGARARVKFCAAKARELGRENR